MHRDKMTCLQMEARAGVKSGLNMAFPLGCFIKYSHIHVRRGEEQLYLR